MGEVKVLPVIRIEREPQTRPAELPPSVSDLSAVRCARMLVRAARRERQSLLKREEGE